MDNNNQDEDPPPRNQFREAFLRAAILKHERECGEEFSIVSKGTRDYIRGVCSKCGKELERYKRDAR